MKQLNRRKFLGQTAIGLGSAFALSQIPQYLLAQYPEAAKNMAIGFQVYPIREMLAKDMPGTLKMMAGLGYRKVEMCSPPGYLDSGFGPLSNLSGKDTKKIIEDAGLICPSCHFTFDELKDKLDDRIEYAKQVGMEAMICSSFWLGEKATLKDYLDSADRLNKIAEKIKNAGMVAGFHNHEMEFARLDGQLIYDALLKQLDPKLVKMQFQTEVINLGFKAADYFSNYPGRFISSHMSDWTKDKKQVPIGQGVIDWKEFFAAAPKGGVKHFYVEMDLSTFKDSAAYIKGLTA